ncbi:MAG: RDD family protein [Ferruginibacter sp.]
MEYNVPGNVQEESANLLDDEILLMNSLVYASTGQRFLNFIIDNLLMRYGISYATGLGIGMLIGIIQPSLVNEIQANSTALFILLYSIWICNTLFYYIICEKLFNGYTLGKLITGTKAIRDDGQPLTFKDVLIRTLCRLVPFEALSGFKIRTWHDEWSNTMVVQSR